MCQNGGGTWRNPTLKDWGSRIRTGSCDIVCCSHQTLRICIGDDSGPCTTRLRMQDQVPNALGAAADACDLRRMSRWVRGFRGLHAQFYVQTRKSWKSSHTQLLACPLKISVCKPHERDSHQTQDMLGCIIIGGNIKAIITVLLPIDFPGFF